MVLNGFFDFCPKTVAPNPLDGVEKVKEDAKSDPNDDNPDEGNEGLFVENTVNEKFAKKGEDGETDINKNDKKTQEDEFFLERGEDFPNFFGKFFGSKRGRGFFGHEKSFFQLTLFSRKLGVASRAFCFVDVGFYEKIEGKEIQLK